MLLTLSLSLSLTLTFDLSTQNRIPSVGYPNVIPNAKFEHFGIIRFWVMLRLLVWKYTYWPRDIDLSTPNPCHF